MRACARVGVFTNALGVQQQVLGCVAPAQETKTETDTHGPLVYSNESRWTKEGMHVHWHGKLGDVPEHPTILLAQEFFDALPVHQFEVRPALVLSSRHGLLRQAVREDLWVGGETRRHRPG